MVDANRFACKLGKMFYVAVNMEKVREHVREWKQGFPGGAPAIAAAIKKATGYETSRQNVESFIAGKDPKFELLHGLARVMGYASTDDLADLKPLPGGKSMAKKTDTKSTAQGIRLSEELTQLIVNGGAPMLTMAESILREHLRMDSLPRQASETGKKAA